MVDSTGVSPGSAEPVRPVGPTARVFVSDQDSQGVIRQSLGDLGIEDAEYTMGRVEAATATLAKQASPRLLIVDLSGVDDPIARMEELNEKCEPDVGVIAVGDRNDIILYRHLKDMGVAEYFFKPLVRDLVKRACSSILFGAREHATSPRTGKLIFVMGVRGGVGATMLAANAGWHLAQSRQQWVMLIDLDLQHGDAALQLDATPSHALREALENPDRVDKLFVERGRIHVTDRLDLFASLEPFSEPFTIPGEDAVLSLFGKLMRRYRYIFVDLPPYMAVGMMRLLHQPSTCLLVSDGGLSSAREVVRWREWIGPNTPERTTLHILNMYGADRALPDKEFARAVEHAPDVIIPYSPEIAAASILGVKATQKCASLNRGLNQLLRIVAGEPEAPPPSLFKRIFG
jgi:pilus assembly protein CpaE